MTTLAERAVACKDWKWLPGMYVQPSGRAGLGGRVVATIDHGDGTQTVFVYHEDEEWHFTTDYDQRLPLLEDPLTAGALPVLCSKAWGVDLYASHRSTNTSLELQEWRIKFLNECSPSAPPRFECYNAYAHSAEEAKTRAWVECLEGAHKR